jgi:hypothetical protein
MRLSIFSFLILVLFALSSCDKTDFAKDEWSKGDKWEWDKGTADKEVCFELVYPVSYSMPDGSTVSGGEEVWGAIKAWYEANPGSANKPELQYPVEIIFKYEVVKTINNEEEMLWAKKACADKEYGDKICFELVYPVSYVLPDGINISADDEKAFWVAIKSWYNENPDVEDKPVLQYPVDIKYKDGSIRTIIDEAAMIEVKEDCFEDDDIE